MKDKINAQFEKNPQFDMSFGLAKDPTTQEDPETKSVDYKNEVNTEMFLKRREEKLIKMKK